jgi:HK97 gp10 family phage protein
MAGIVGLKLDGTSPLLAKMRQLPADLQSRYMLRALRRGANRLADAVRAAAPLGTEPSRKTRTVGTLRVAIGRRRRVVRLSTGVSVSYDYGRLRENIRARVRSRLYKGIPVLRVSPGRAFWGLFLEKGTKRQGARPFFQRTVAANLDAMEGEILKDLESVLRDQFRREGRRVRVRTARGSAP